MLYIFSNPTPNITNNITWDIFNDYNLTYLIIDEHAHLWFQYRQNKYGFWKDFIPKYAVQDYCKYLPTKVNGIYLRNYKHVYFIYLLISITDFE